MHTHAKEMPLWQKALLFALTAALVLGLSPAPLLAGQAYAADGAQLKAGEMSKSLTTNSETINLKVFNNTFMFKVAEGSQLVTDGADAKLVFKYPSDSFSKAFVGTAAEADKAAEADTVPYADGEFLLTVSGKTDGKPFPTAFYSKKNQKWYERWMVLDKEASVLYVGDTEKKVVDLMAAKKVDELIAKIQVQERTATTDADCKAAKDAWDALTEDQQALVEEYDYFGRPTGDASKDDPLNANKIGKNEILVVSFGTSFNDSRVQCISSVEKAIQKTYPKWSVRRAFTAQIIINHIQARDGEKIDNMQQALQRAKKNKVKNLVIAPTHLMHGAEYDELVQALKPYKKSMNIQISEPLLGKYAAGKKTVNADKKAVAEAVVAAAVKDAGYKSQAAMDKAGAALVLMGHGTEHKANVAYLQMQQAMKKLGYKNVFVGTVEGLPAGTDCASIINKVKKAGYKTVYLRPLMVVAGDHANNDMADSEDEESWYSQFTASGAFNDVQCQIKGLGQIKAVQKQYVSHAADVIQKDSTLVVEPVKATQTVKSGKKTTIAAKKVFKVTKNTSKAKVTFKKTKGNDKITVSSKGKVTVKKGLAKGTYKVKVKATTKATPDYKSASSTVQFKVTVK